MTKRIHRARHAQRAAAFVWLFGTVLAGVVFPLSALQAFADSIPWTTKLLQSKDAYEEPAAKKIAEITEDHVIGGLAFSPDGEHLATNSQLDGTDVHLWTWRASANLARKLDRDAPPGDGNAIKFNPRGGVLAVGHERGGTVDSSTVVRLWDTNTGKVLGDIQDPDDLSGPELGIGFSTDGKFLYRTANHRKQSGLGLIVYDTDSLNEVWDLATYPLMPNVLAISPNGRFVALSGTSNVGQIGHLKAREDIMVVDVAARKISRVIEGAFESGSTIESMAWSADGQTIWAGSFAIGPSGQQVEGVGLYAIKGFNPVSGAEVYKESVQYEALVTSLLCSADGRYLVEGRIDGKVQIWDGQHKRLLQKIPVSTNFHEVISISRDSKYLAIGVGKQVAIWQFN